MSLPTLCHVVTVAQDDLPRGHSFVIVRDGREATVFAADEPRAQLEARLAYLVWERSSGVSAPVG